jgi:hypothetical protein
MSYPFTTVPYGSGWAPYGPNNQPDPGLWLSSLTGQHYAKFVAGLRTAIVDFETDSENIETGNVEKIKADKPLAEANSVGSLYLPRGAPKGTDGVPSHFSDGPTHKPVLDIDVPAMLVPSSTPGHHHLYIDAPMSWPDYVKLMKVLGEVGILQKGYVHASIQREGSWVRAPWIRKGAQH